MPTQHINSVINIKLLRNSIVIFDRGYPSYDMFNFLEKNGLFFLIRVLISYKIAESINSNGSTLNYKFGVYSKEVRVIKVELPDGTIEVLLINIFDKSIITTSFKELYFFLGGLECKYKKLKSSIEIEEFLGSKPITIEQNFYLSIIS